MQSRKTEIPRPALILGLGGLLPFMATAIAVWYQPGFGSESPSTSGSAHAVHALGAYGAVILSFLGGVRWGSLLHDDARLQQWAPLSLSVLPSLIGWCALLLSAPAMLLLLTAGFVSQYFLDLYAVRRLELPSWFGRLRLVLSSGAVLSLTVALLGISMD